RTDGGAEGGRRGGQGRQAGRGAQDDDRQAAQEGRRRVGRQAGSTRSRRPGPGRRWGGDVGLDLCPSTAFRDAVASMLDGLAARTGLGTWMLLRLHADGGSSVLAVRDRTYGIEADQELADGELPARGLVDGRGPPG